MSPIEAQRVFVRMDGGPSVNAEGRAGDLNEKTSQAAPEDQKEQPIQNMQEAHVKLQA